MKLGQVVYDDAIISRLRNKLAIINGLAGLIEEGRASAFDIHRAKTITRTVREVSVLMGWHTEAAEIREAAGASKNPDAHLGSEASE